jgi:hypothetical protein
LIQFKSQDSAKQIRLRTFSRVIPLGGQLSMMQPGAASEAPASTTETPASEMNNETQSGPDRTQEDLDEPAVEETPSTF